jgi:hypothetical protein
LYRVFGLFSVPITVFIQPCCPSCYYPYRSFFLPTPPEAKRLWSICSRLSSPASVVYSYTDTGALGYRAARRGSRRISCNNYKLSLQKTLQTSYIAFTTMTNNILDTKNTATKETYNCTSQYIQLYSPLSVESVAGRYTLLYYYCHPEFLFVFWAGYSCFSTFKKRRFQQKGILTAVVIFRQEQI